MRVRAAAKTGDDPEDQRGAPPCRDKATGALWGLFANGMVAKAWATSAYVDLT